MYAIRVLLMLLPVVLTIGQPPTNRRQPFGPIMCQQFCQRTTNCSSFYFSASLLSCQLQDKRCDMMSAPYTLHVLKETSIFNHPPSVTESQGTKTTPRCVRRKPKGYVALKYGNKVMFTKLKTKPSTWKSALKSCQRDGGVLVQPKTKDYEEIILKKYPYFSNRKPIKRTAWIGMVDDPDVNDFHWVDGDCLNHDNWGPGDPSHMFRNHKENCVIYRAGKWFDTNCKENHQYFLCEICGMP